MAEPARARLHRAGAEVPSRKDLAQAELPLVRRERAGINIPAWSRRETRQPAYRAARLGSSHSRRRLISAQPASGHTGPLCAGALAHVGGMRLGWPTFLCG